METITVSHEQTASLRLLEDVHLLKRLVFILLLLHDKIFNLKCKSARGFGIASLTIYCTSNRPDISKTLTLI